MTEEELEKEHREYGLLVIDIIKKNYSNDTCKDKEIERELCEKCEKCEEFWKVMNGGRVSFDYFVICEHEKKERINDNDPTEDKELKGEKNGTDTDRESSTAFCDAN